MKDEKENEERHLKNGGGKEKREERLKKVIRKQKSLSYYSYVVFKADGFGL
jgi:hypothetical protein